MRNLVSGIFFLALGVAAIAYHKPPARRCREDWKIFGRRRGVYTLGRILCVIVGLWLILGGLLLVSR